VIVKGIELHFDPKGATALTSSGTYRLNRDQVTDLFKVLTIRPPEANLRQWLAERHGPLAALSYPGLSREPRAHRFPGCKVCDHKMRDQIEAEIDKHRSRRGIASRYGVPVADVREHRLRGKHRIG